MKQLDKRKKLASKVLGVGKKRIRFDPASLADIKEAITKQDIRELYQEGFITIKPVKGRRIIIRRKTKKRFGKMKRKVKMRKERYVKLVRKLRKYVKELKNKKRINQEDYLELRKKIKAKIFKSESNLKEHLKEKAK